MTELTDRTRCLLGNPEEPHAATLGLLVCGGHQEKLYGQLRGIVDTVARIAIRAANSGSPGAGRSGSLASQRFVLDLESVALAGPQASGELTKDGGWDAVDENHPLYTVETWARLVREERGIGLPTDPATLAGEVDLLVRHLDWCCAQPWIDDMAGEIGAASARVHAADPDRHRPGDEGRCPAVGVGPGGSCGGQLRRERGAVPWVVRADRCERAPLDVRAGIVRCQRCGASWPTERDEASLRVLRLDAAREALRPTTEDGRPMRTAAELAEAWGIKRPTVAVWAFRAGVKAVRGYYDADAIRPKAASA